MTLQPKVKKAAFFISINVVEFKAVDIDGVTYYYKDGAPYYYMMNGQTGRVCGKLPIDKKRLLATALGVGLAVFLVLCVGGAFIW